MEEAFSMAYSMIYTLDSRFLQGWECLKLWVDKNISLLLQYLPVFGPKLKHSLVYKINLLKNLLKISNNNYFYQLNKKIKNLLEDK